MIIDNSAGRVTNRHRSSDHKLIDLVKLQIIIIRRPSLANKTSVTVKFEPSTPTRLRLQLIE
jgi:hypothetical protein